MSKLCLTCQQPIAARNKSGYCRTHVSAALAACPENRAKQVAGIRRKLATDPAYLDNLRKRAKSLSLDPTINEARSKRFTEARIWEIGTVAAANVETRARAGRAISAARLSWCPSHLRPAYHVLVRSKRLPAAEARAMILEQHEAEMARWRREVAA